MSDSAAAVWSAMSTAAVSLVDAGSLAEDADRSNIVAEGRAIIAPEDVKASAARFPVGVIFDADGSAIDAVFDNRAGAATSCENDAVWRWIDNICVAGNASRFGDLRDRRFGCFHAGIVARGGDEPGRVGEHTEHQHAASFDRRASVGSLCFQATCWGIINMKARLPWTNRRSPFPKKRPAVPAS